MGRDELLKKIDEVQRQTGIADTAIGMSAMNDAKFVSSLRAGRRCYPETIAKVVAFLDEHEKEAMRLQTICTEDGTWIAHDRRSGLAHSGRTPRVAETNLRKLMDQMVPHLTTGIGMTTIVPMCVRTRASR